MIKILAAPEDIRPYLENIMGLADDQKGELGFIPYSAYRESSFKGNLLVAVFLEKEERVFAGYILLGGRFPTKRIFQLAVVPKYRNKGVGRALVDAAVQEADKRRFHEIIIRVGETLPANKFWEKLQFDLICTVKGGQLHSTLNVRMREIAPSLFSHSMLARPGLQWAADRILSEPTLYLLDTNILLDISTERPDSDASKNLLRLVGRGDIEVAIAQEAIEELQRSRRKSNDTALDIAGKLPRFSLNNGKDLMTRLRSLVFPGKDEIRRRDESDIKLIATAIFNEAKGFITRDKHILERQEILRDKFSLEVLSPVDFWSEYEIPSAEAIALGSMVKQEELVIQPGLTGSMRTKIMETFSEHTIDESKFEYASLQTDGTSVAFCAVQKRLPRGGRARDAVLFLPDNSSKRAVSTTLDFISQRFMSEAQPGAISLALCGRGGQIEDVLLDRGYHKSDDNNYRKICAGPVISACNWNEKKGAIKEMSGISLPDIPPDYADFNQDVALGRGRKAPLNALEDFLSAILLLPGRNGVIVPIKKWYADAFFAHSTQISLLPSPEAQLSAYKSYFGTRRVASRMAVGKLLFFYQSKDGHEPGRIVTFARIVRSNIASKNATEKEARRRGVLSDKGFEELTKDDTVLETVFTHSAILPNPITLERLRQIGCADKANFVTAFNIDHLKVCKLLKEGGIL